MFSVLFKQKNRIETAAEDLYEFALINTREEIFYKDAGVPDTFDGRFDLLLLHIYIQMHRIMDEADYVKISQKLFDITFRDMDQTLREMGIGDMGIPKHMKRMMKAFNGRMHAYQAALEGEGQLSEVLQRNLFGTTEHVEAHHIQKMETFVKSNIENKDTQSFNNTLEV